MKKIVVIGFGFMGVVHAKNILNCPGLELGGIVENRPGDIFAGLDKTGNQGTLQMPIEQLRRTPVFNTLAECVDKVRPDAVSICLPLFLHYQAAKQALELGLDVLLEKPFCQEVEQCRELIELAEAKGRILMVAHCVRFAPAWELLADCIRDERYGKLHLLTTMRMGGEPNWGVWKDAEIKKTCGGSLFDLLIHDIDFIIYCLGMPSDTRINMKCDEYWELLFQCDSAVKISVKGGFLHKNAVFSSEYAATFEHASLRYNTLQPEFTHIGTDKGAETIITDGDAYCNELQYFTECIQKRVLPVKCLPEDSMNAINICQQIRTMADSHN